MNINLKILAFNRCLWECRLSSPAISLEPRMLNEPRRSQITTGTPEFTHPPACHASHLPSVAIVPPTGNKRPWLGPRAQHGANTPSASPLHASNGTRRSYQMCTTEWIIPEIIAFSMFVHSSVYRRNHFTEYQWIFSLNRIPWNLPGLASIALSENHRTVTSASDCNRRLTMLNSLPFTDTELSSA